MKIRLTTRLSWRTSFAALLAVAWCGDAAGSLAGSPAVTQSGRRDPARIFAGFKRKHDKDLDGRVSREEFTGRSRAWSRLDVDGDGYITLADMEARAKTDQGARDDSPSSGPESPSLATTDQIKFFETKVRPVLANECFSCHSSSGRSKGDLSLDSLSGFLIGGSSGPALVPGDPSASAFIEAIRYEDPGFSMPPKNKLKPEEIADLEAWVRMGAPWPDEVPPEMIEMAPSELAGADADEAGGEGLNREIDIEAGKLFWSFQPVTRPTVPVPRTSQGAKAANGPRELWIASSCIRCRQLV